MAIRDDITQATYDLLNSWSDAENYDEERVVNPKIDDVVSSVCKGYVVDIRDRTAPPMRAGYLPFLRQTTFIEKANDPFIAQDVAKGADTLYLSEVTVPSDATRIYCNGNIITFTASESDTIGTETVTKLTGVTGVLLSHKAGDFVYFLYALPGSISKPYQLDYVYDSDTFDPVTIKDYTKKPLGYQYAEIIIDNDGTELVHIKGFSAGDKFRMFYDKQDTKMTAGDSVCTIPDDRCLKVVPLIAAAEILWENEETEEASDKISMGYSKLLEMYGFFAKQSRKTERRIKSGNPIFSPTRGYGKRQRGHRR